MERVERVSTYMLIDQQNPNILPLRRKPHKRIVNILCLRLGVYDEEVLLRVRRGGDVLLRWAISTPSSSLVGSGYGLREHTPTPARSNPVTESCRQLARHRGVVHMKTRAEGGAEDKPHPQ